MLFFSKTWVRVVLSLIGGGLTTEIIFLTSGDPYRDRTADEPNFTLLYAFIIFLILTGVVNMVEKKKLF